MSQFGSTTAPETPVSYPVGPPYPASTLYPATPVFSQIDFERAQARTEKEKHLARAAKADADTAETLAEAASLAHCRDLRHWEYETAGDSEQRIFRFATEVSPGSVQVTIDQIMRWHRLDSHRPDFGYTIYITSPGGAVMPGIGLYHCLKNLGKLRPLTTVVSGFCASMATIVYQAGTHRQIEQASSLLIHDISSVAAGDTHSLQDTATWMGVVNHDLHKILATRSTLTVDEIAERSKRRDWTLNAEQAVEYGFADEVI